MSKYYPLSMLDLFHPRSFVSRAFTNIYEDIYRRLGNSFGTELIWNQFIFHFWNWCRHLGGETQVCNFLLDLRSFSVESNEGMWASCGFAGVDTEYPKATYNRIGCWFDTSSEICAVPRDYGGVPKIAKESGTNNKVKCFRHNKIG